MERYARIARTYSFWSKTLWSEKQHMNRILKRFGSAYEAEGKTTVSILNKSHHGTLMINSFSQYGFRLNNDMVVVGPMAIFPRTVMSWNVNSLEDINEDSLIAFYTLEPKVDILIIGIGDIVPTKLLLKEVVDFMRKYKINVEILRTEQACATFNFLNAENRTVAAALIPPVHISYNENDVLQTKIKKQNFLMDESDDKV